MGQTSGSFNRRTILLRFAVRERLAELIRRHSILSGETAKLPSLVILDRQAGGQVALGSIVDQLFQSGLKVFHLNAPLYKARIMFQLCNSVVSVLYTAIGVRPSKLKALLIRGCFNSAVQAESQALPAERTIVVAHDAASEFLGVLHSAATGVDAAEPFSSWCVSGLHKYRGQ